MTVEKKSVLTKSAYRCIHGDQSTKYSYIESTQQLIGGGVFAGYQTGAPTLEGLQGQAVPLNIHS